MNVNVAIAETHIDYTRVDEPSTRSNLATREEVFKNTFLKNKRIIEPEPIGLERESNQVANVITIPQFKTVPEQLVTPFLPLQEWEGYVQTIGKDTFTASLLDITKKRTIEDEEADFLISDLTEDDKRLLKLGAVFRWIIGYRSIVGTKERVSKIVFRRLPQWTESDLQAAHAKAKDIASKIKWE